MRVLRLAVAALLIVSGLSVPTGAQVDPETVCATNLVLNVVQEERYFCEPLNSGGFVQYYQFLEGLDFLQASYPDYIEVYQIGESIEGRPLMFVEVTNEKSTVPRAEKLQIGYSASIHANEPAGREGMTRVMEDLAGGIGPYGAQLQPLLDHVILNVWFPNADSWAQGDYFSPEGIAGVHPGTGFARANAAGVDLNREFPSPGWISPPHTPMSEPESRAVVNELRFSGNHTNLVAGTDLHGMINSPNMIRSIIPNQDYDFRRMVLAVDMLRTTQDRVASNPAFLEWQTADMVANTAMAAANGLPAPVPDPGAAHDKPFEWGARWDMIGYTDSGFTSDYLMLSPRSPTGGMGAVGTIVEFAYSHMVPDNHYVAKLTDMHVAGVREIVRTQLELAGRLETPMLAGTGNVGYIWTDSYVSSDNDPMFYTAASGKDFDLNDPEARFEFNQVPYNVTNLNFWRDLNQFSKDPIMPLDAATFAGGDLGNLSSLVITNQALDGLFPDQISAIADWVSGGGHLLLTDSGIRFLSAAGIVPADTVGEQCVYLGHSDIQEMTHPLVAGVDWAARVTGEGPATGHAIPGKYPQWGVEQTAFLNAGGDIVGTTQGSPAASSEGTCGTGDTLSGAMATLGRLQHGDGTIDILGGALPMPTQAFDHRYGLADYSVSALTYFIVMNSLGGEITWDTLETPFIPFYPYDPLYGDPEYGKPTTDDGKDGESDVDVPGPALVIILAAIAVALAVARRK